MLSTNKKSYFGALMTPLYSTLDDDEKSEIMAQ